jgi:hypothetical protein
LRLKYNCTFPRKQFVLNLIFFCVWRLFSRAVSPAYSETLIGSPQICLNSHWLLSTVSKSFPVHDLWSVPMQLRVQQFVDVHYWLWQCDPFRCIAVTAFCLIKVRGNHIFSFRKDPDWLWGIPPACAVDTGCHCSGVKHAGLGADLSLASSAGLRTGVASTGTTGSWYSSVNIVTRLRVRHPRIRSTDSGRGKTPLRLVRRWRMSGFMPSPPASFHCLYMGDFNFTLILYPHLFPKEQRRNAGLLLEEEHYLQVTFSFI